MTLNMIAIELLTIREDLYARTNGGFTGDADEIYIFDQVWGSTALGFGGMGGQAMTRAMTYVIIQNYEDAYVYFGSRFAYHCKATVAFMEDLKNRRMVSVMESGKYECSD